MLYSFLYLRSAAIGEKLDVGYEAWFVRSKQDGADGSTPRSLRASTLSITFCYDRPH